MKQKQRKDLWTREIRISSDVPQFFYLTKPNHKPETAYILKQRKETDTSTRYKLLSINYTLNKSSHYGITTQ